jgi:hypothetical protein
VRKQVPKTYGIPDSKVRAWLEKEGYPLELSVGRAFRERGWFVYHTRHYTSPENGRPRQVDAVAGKQAFQTGPKAVLGWQFAVECKRSRKPKPWIILASGAQLSETLAPTRFLPGFSARELVDQFQARVRIDVKSVLNWGALTGHGVVQCFSGEEEVNPAFAAVRSAVSASCALAREADKSHHALHRGLRLLYVTLPLVVVDAPLFEAFVNDAGDLTLNPVTHSRVLVADPLEAPEVRRVEIVTPPALPQLIDRASEDFEKLSAAIPDLIAEVMANCAAEAERAAWKEF